MSDRLLIDADVLIDFFRRRPGASNFVRGLTARPFIGVITVAELFAGVREGEERVALERFLSRCTVVDLDEQICTAAGLLLRQFRKSHGIGLADALVAAAAESVGARVVTLNAKHFPMVQNLLVPYARA